jgi:hypothetical protein
MRGHALSFIILFFCFFRHFCLHRA